MAKGSGCCCSLCGVQLPPEANGCCLCVCSDICVEVTGGGGCDCVDAFALLSWSHSDCAYVGSIGCGSLTIDLRFEVKKCSDGTCRLCLTSTCLGLTGQCGNAGCNEFSPGHNGDCGKYLKDCDQSGGWDETWTVDGTNCLPPDSVVSCPSITITAECYDRVNPAGGGMTRLCKDCDCVCECVAVSYSESLAGAFDTEFVCWNEQWSATLVSEPTEMSPSVTQTANVEIIRDDETGCCYWKVTITRGVFAEGYPGAGTKVAMVKTGCPDVDIELGIDGLPAPDETGIGILTIECGACGPCPHGERILIHFNIADSYIDWSIGIEHEEYLPFAGAPATYVFSGVSGGHSWTCTINLGLAPTPTTVTLVVNVVGGGEPPYSENPTLTYVNGTVIPGHDGSIPWAINIGSLFGPDSIEGWDETPSVGEDDEVGFITIQIDCSPEVC